MHDNLLMRYKSCPFIQYGLQFNQDSVSICYQNSNKGGGYRNIPLMPNFKGGKLDIRKINDFKRKLIDEEIKGNCSPVCDGCIMLHEDDWDDFDGKVKQFNLDYWTWCNSQCVYCYTNGRKDFYNTQKTYNFLEILQDLKEHNLLGRDGDVNFGGGEVSLLDEFDEIMKIFYEYRYSIMIHTGAIDYLPILEQGLSAGRVHLVVSVDAGTEETHAKVKQVRTYKKVWANLEKYAKFQSYPNQVKSKFIIVPGINDSEYELQLWLEKSKKVGVNNVYVEIESCYFEENRNNIPDKIYKLFEFSKKKAQQLELKFNLYERASHMMSESSQYKDFYKGCYNTDF